MIAEAMQNNQYGWSLLLMEASMTTFNRVPHIAVTVRDMRVSASWYERVLGFDFVEELRVPPGAAMSTSTSTVVAIAAPTFSNAERLALAGFLAGYTGLTRAGVDPGLGFANLRASTRRIGAVRAWIWRSCSPVRERPFPFTQLCGGDRVPDDFREGGRRVERGRMAGSFDLAKGRGRDHPGERFGDAHDG
jgi:catechol 2,3-dioxygenase-like lactoylglutathione lyase family enzyme